MAFTEDLSVFFNVNEFSEPAIIKGKSVIGIFSYSTILVNEVETRKPVFTYAEKEVLNLKQGSVVRVRQQCYRVIGLKPDGTGMMTLILAH